MTDATRRVSAVAGSSPSAQTSKSTPNQQRTSSFRDALDEANRKRAKSGDRKRPTDKESKTRSRDGASPLLAQPDGTFVVTNPALIGAHGLASLTGAGASSSESTSRARGGAARSTLEAPTDASLDDRSLAVEQVRVGRAGDTVRVHATLGAGEHKGVELRAVERNGKIEVELCAKDSVAAERLRSEMSGLRDTLDASGNERVSVSVVDASGASAGAGDRPRDDPSQRRREDSQGGDGSREHSSDGRARDEGEGATADEQDPSAPRPRWRLL